MNDLIRVYTFPKGTNQGETYDLGRYRLEKLNTILPRTDGCCGPFYDLEGNLAPYAKVGHFAYAVDLSDHQTPGNPEANITILPDHAMYLPKEVKVKKKLPPKKKKKGKRAAWKRPVPTREPMAKKAAATELKTLIVGAKEIAKKLDKLVRKLS